MRIYFDEPVEVTASAYIAKLADGIKAGDFELTIDATRAEGEDECVFSVVVSDAGAGDSTGFALSSHGDDAREILKKSFTLPDDYTNAIMSLDVTGSCTIDSITLIREGKTVSKLKIDDIVQVSVSTARPVTPRDAFDTGLILGASAHITTTERVKVYTDLDGMVDDGFLTTDPEYKAAELYFSQDPRPQKLVVGRRDGTLTEGVAAETWVEALTACRDKSGEWYACYIANASLTKADHQAVAAYIQTLVAAYFFDSHASDDVNASSSTDVFSTLKGLAYGRSIGIYSGTAYAGAALMGFAMGANDGTPGSAYTLFGKTLVGVAADDLTETQVGTLRGKNANYYINRGNAYTLLEQGVTADGTWFDELIGIDQLANDLQISCMDVLTKTKTKVPYTDAGALQFVVACNEACYGAARRGFIAPGVWTKDSVLELEKGDTLENGYMCQASPVANEPAANRGLRKSPPIYVCVILAGAIHSVAIKVIVE